MPDPIDKLNNDRQGTTGPFILWGSHFRLSIY